jgi:hypothetical protein
VATIEGGLRPATARVPANTPDLYSHRKPFHEGIFRAPTRECVNQPKRKKQRMLSPLDRHRRRRRRKVPFGPIFGVIEEKETKITKPSFYCLCFLRYLLFKFLSAECGVFASATAFVALARD